MNQQQNNFLNIITAYVSGIDDSLHTPIIENPNWNEIYNLSRIHSLSGMLYKVVQSQNLCSDEELMGNMDKAFMLTVGNFMRQEFAISSLLNLLNSNKIKHIIFKGAVLREYYPDKALRTMGDIDIIIDAADKERTHEVLLDAGASFDEVASHGDVSNYKLNGILFEIHTRVIETNLFEDVDYKGYFSDLFSHAELRGYSELREVYTYELKREYHLIYLLVHMAKHFKFGGCGLRMYIDIVMFLRHFAHSAGNSSVAGNPDGHHIEAELDPFVGDLDWGYIEAELEKLRLIDFADSVFQFCNRWFGTDIALFKKERSTAEMDMITEYVLAGGTFGYHDKNIDAIRAGNKDNGLISKIKTVVFFIFPSYEHLKRRYEWMKNTPRWMLPIAWVRYWYYRIFVVKQDNLKRIKDAAGNSDDAWKHYQLMEKIGLE